MSINKKILKSYELLYKWNQQHKFNPKKNRSFIHLYLLYIQNKYRLNFDFKKYTKQKIFHECLNSLYENTSVRHKKGLLFSEDNLLSDIFFLDDKFSIDKYLSKLEETTYSLNYVSTNIQVVDYLGNTDNDVSVVRVAFCLLIFKEQFPLIKINSKLQKNIISNLIKTATPKRGEINYVNSEAIMLLFLLKKINLYPQLEEYIQILLKTQKTNGLWINGFNSYLIDNAPELDYLHTALGLIILLEYQIVHTMTKMISPSPSELTKNKLTKNKLTKNELTKNKLTKNKSNHQETIEHFDNISDLGSSSFYLDLNFYNTTLILVLILVAINIPRIKDIKL